MDGSDREMRGRKWSAPDFVLAAWVFYLGSTVFKLGSTVFVFQIVPSLYQKYTTVLPKLYHRCSPQYVEQCMVFWCFDKLFGDFYFILRGLFWGGVGF